MQEHRYLILAEGHFGPASSKTANSAIRYLPDRILAVIDSTHAGGVVSDVLGFGGDIPILSTVDEGLSLEPSALLIGIAPAGGQLPDAWRPPLRAAINAGLDIVSGLHFYLADDKEISFMAAEKGVRLFDLRKPPADLPVSTGLAREVEPLVVLTVGTDCNIGKMTAGLQIRAALTERGTRVGFAATGQTGILIEGWGIAVDAVVADFIGGAAERLVLQAAQDGPDIVMVEGQGALVHPGYSGVTLGLLHGSMPEAMIMCHQPSRKTVYGSGGAYHWVPLPSLSDSIRMYEDAIAPLRPAKVVGIALNTWDLSEEEAREAIRSAEQETGLPATDPVRFDAGPLADAILGFEGARPRRERVAAG
jgi:uncharacterized NAD-dependent epimerase/dehydratase family protein